MDNLQNISDKNFKRVNLKNNLNQDEILQQVTSINDEEDNEKCNLYTDNKNSIKKGKNGLKNDFNNFNYYAILANIILYTIILILVLIYK